MKRLVIGVFALALSACAAEPQASQEAQEAQDDPVEQVQASATAAPVSTMAVKPNFCTFDVCGTNGDCFFSECGPTCLNAGTGRLGECTDIMPF